MFSKSGYPTQHSFEEVTSIDTVTSATLCTYLGLIEQFIGALYIGKTSLCYISVVELLKFVCLTTTLNSLLPLQSAVGEWCVHLLQLLCCEITSEDIVTIKIEHDILGMAILQYVWQGDSSVPACKISNCACLQLSSFCIATHLCIFPQIRKVMVEKFVSRQPDHAFHTACENGVLHK